MTARSWVCSDSPLICRALHFQQVCCQCRAALELCLVPASVLRSTFPTRARLISCSTLACSHLAAFACLQGWGLDYFRSSWHVVDFLSVGLMVVCIIIWWEFVIRDAIPFDIQLR